MSFVIARMLEQLSIRWSVAAAGAWTMIFGLVSTYKVREETLHSPSFSD